MRQIYQYLILISLLFSSSSFAFKIKANEILLFGSSNNQKTVFYIVDKNDISNIPNWNGEGNVPLAENKARELAINKHKEKFGKVKTKFKSIKLKSKSTHCKNDLKCPDKLWYYKIKIRGDKKATYVVLLDGSFVNFKSK